MRIIKTYPRFWQNPLGNLMLRQIALRRFSLETCVIISTPMPHRKELRFACRTSFVFSISKFAACSPLVHSLLVQLARWTFSTRDTVSSFSPRPTWRIAQEHSSSRIDKMLSIRYTFNIQSLTVLTTMQTLVLRASRWDDSSETPLVRSLLIQLGRWTVQPEQAEAYKLNGRNRAELMDEPLLIQLAKTMQN